MDTTTGIGRTIMRTLGSLGLPALTALALLVFAIVVTGMLALDLVLSGSATVVMAPLRW